MNRAEREHRQAITRYVTSLTSFLHGWEAAAHLRDDPNRDDVLAALSDYDRARFLDIEQRITGCPGHGPGYQLAALAAQAARLPGGAA